MPSGADEDPADEGGPAVHEPRPDDAARSAEFVTAPCSSQVARGRILQATRHERPESSSAVTPSAAQARTRAMLDRFAGDRRVGRALIGPMKGAMHGTRVGAQR